MAILTSLSTTHVRLDFAQCLVLQEVGGPPLGNNEYRRASSCDALCLVDLDGIDLQVTSMVITTLFVAHDCAPPARSTAR